jgi:hypothetical protein
MLEFARSPLAWVVVCALVLHVVGIGWGLPASDGWDDDGVAPRDFIVGTYMTFWRGHYFTYPPVHLAALTLLTLPVTLIGLVRAASWTPADVVAELVRVPYMTAYSIAARAVTEVMAVGIVLVIGRLGETLWGRRAGALAAAVAGLNVVFTYYAHTSNLDVPYLFWALLALACLARCILRGEPARTRRMALFAVLAVGTKDQAYAMFALSVPLSIAAWFAADPWAREKTRFVLRELALSGVGAIGLFVIVDGALFNPSGFARRLAFLTGTASQDHTSYAKNWAGWGRVLSDCILFFGRYYPSSAFLLVVAGTAIHVGTTRGEPRRLVAGLVPAFAVVSFTIAFNCVARRTEHRFLLPQSLLVSLYAGLALDTAIRSARKSPVLVGSVAALIAIVAGRALFDCLAVDVALLRDPRYDAEAWLESHVGTGDTIEVYGHNAYLPRLPGRTRVTRVDPSPASSRSPMPGITEMQAAYDEVEQRSPDWIVVGEGWLWRYTKEAPPPGGAFVVAPAQISRQNDLATRAYFASLLDGTNAMYALDHAATYDDHFWPRVDIHASTTRNVFVFRRRQR